MCGCTRQLRASCVAAVLLYKRHQSSNEGGKLPRTVKTRTRDAHANPQYENKAFNDTQHYERGAISRVEAEKELASGMPGAFVVRVKGTNKVITSLVRPTMPDGTAAKFAHNMIAEQSHGLPLLFNSKTAIGSPPHTNIHEAIVYLATPKGAAELGLEVPLVGVVDEELYGQTVYGSDRPKRMESGAYGKTVYAVNPETRNASKRCPKCSSRMQFCMCNVTSDERHRARTMTAGAKSKIAGMHSRTLDSKTPAMNRQSIERFNSEDDDAHDYVNTRANASATMA